ncbi:S41 family peptidase [Paraburkholderia sp. BR13439]|uniref:S41 family peptidase n=1 Tax=Paraburkholderia TaxID=1822464 RepID=UPI0034CFAFF6
MTTLFSYQLVAYRTLKAIALMAMPLFAFGASQGPLSDADIRDITQVMRKDLLDKYPFPDVSKRYSDTIARLAAAGRYSHMDACAFATNAGEDLQATHSDKHLRLVCDAEARAQAAAQKSAQVAGPIARDGVREVELQSGLSLAYIDARGHWSATTPTYLSVVNAMNGTATARSVIIDVRDNPGGSGTVGRLLASYFYNVGEEKFYLNGFYKDRSQDEQEWTYAYVPGRRNPNAKLYILVNSHTASAAEGFAFAMQNLKRAVIVGQRTDGAGIAGGFVPLGHGLYMFLPMKMVVAPHSTLGWEGKGVVPDVVVPEGEEKAAAIALVRRSTQ